MKCLTNLHLLRASGNSWSELCASGCYAFNKLHHYVFYREITAEVEILRGEKEKMQHAFQRLEAENDRLRKQLQ